MGWTGHQMEIPIGMLIKKMYCSKCGSMIRRYKITKLLHKGEYGFDNYLGGGVNAIGMDKLQKTTYVYRCPNCGNITTYDEQKLISKKQKKCKSKILSEDNKELVYSPHSICCAAFFRFS